MILQNNKRYLCLKKGNHNIKKNKIPPYSNENLKILKKKIPNLKKKKKFKKL